MTKAEILAEMGTTWQYVSPAAIPPQGTPLDDGSRVYDYQVRERNGNEERSHTQQIIVYDETGPSEEALYWGERKTPVKKVHDFVDFMRQVLDNNYGGTLPNTNIPTRGFHQLGLSTRYESVIFMALEGPEDGPYTAKIYYARKVDGSLDAGEITGFDPAWMDNGVYGTPVELV